MDSLLITQYVSYAARNSRASGGAEDNVRYTDSRVLEVVCDILHVKDYSS